jgi:hypothetical protein
MTTVLARAEWAAARLAARAAFQLQAEPRLTVLEQKANNRAWTTGIASPITHSSWSESPAASALAAAPIASSDWPRSSGRRLAFAISWTASSYDCLWRAEARSKKGKSACGVYLPDPEQLRPPDGAWDGEASPGQEGMNYLTCAPTAEYAVSSAVSGLEAEHPLTPTIASTAKKRQSLRDPAHIRNP